MPNTYVALEGGLDLETPPLEARPGACLEALNCYESVKGGYTFLRGYERFDGGPSPAEGAYYRVLIDNYDLRADAVDTSLGATVTVSSLSGVVVYRAQNYDNTKAVLILAEAEGNTPTTDEFPIQFDTGAEVSAVDYNGIADTAWEEGSRDQYLTLAQQLRRDAVSPLPGSGAVAGVAQINGQVIGWRGDAGVLKAYRANAGTWDEIPTVYLYRVGVAGAPDALYGNVCNTGADIIVGVYDSLDTAGVAVADEKVFAVRRVSGSGPTSFTRDSDSAVLGTVSEALGRFEPASGGKVSYINHNFYAGLLTYNTYFADGINCAMFYNTEHDCIQPISSDYRRLPEVCKHVIAHNQRLFMSTTGGTSLTSVVGQPDVLDGFLGAQEIGVGDDITGYAATSSDNLAIFTRNRTFAFSGTSAEDWQKRIASENSGAVSHCIAQIDDVFSSDDRGITRLSRVEALGGFDAGTVTDDVQSLFSVIALKGTCAVTFRRLNQMRFYYGGQFLILSRVPYNANGNEGIRYGITEGYYPVEVLCVSAGEDSAGQERVMFGSEDGFVYWMDRGASFDGEPMDAVLALHFHHLGSPLVRKRYLGIEVEAKTGAEATVDVYYYMNDGKKTFNPRTLAFPGAPGTFNVSRFDESVFDSVPLTRPRMSLRGTGYNIQLSFYRKSAHEPPITLTGYTMRYKQRGLSPI